MDNAHHVISEQHENLLNTDVNTAVTQIDIIQAGYKVYDAFQNVWKS